MDVKTTYQQASLKTADNLRTIAKSVLARDLSHLSLPEVNAVVEAVSQVLPAGNVPGVILNGLARLPERKLPPNILQRDIHLLFKGVEQVLDKAVYGTFFAGPAAVIWGYQNLLKLAGKDPAAAFPEGTWQFYVDYALREDTARHANEAHGFDTILQKYQVQLSPLNRITAWAMACLHALYTYPAMLENEWRERVYTRLLQDVTQAHPQAAKYARLYRDWEGKRPYSRGSDAGQETYAQYRRRLFDQFIEAALSDLDTATRRAWLEKVQTAKAQELPAYLRQMSILAYLDPGAYGETRTPYALGQAHLGLIYRGRYFLLPVCTPGGEQLLEPQTVKSLVNSLLMEPARDALPVTLAKIKRAAWAGLRPKLSREVNADLEALRYTPLIINCDPRPRSLPLSELRQAERGVGDHALTIFDTGSSFVFDQSHIFFDGSWGAALAEILTNEALTWAMYLHQLPTPAAQETGVRLRTLTFPLRAAEVEALQKAPRVTAEAGAETELINVKPILALRRVFKQRSDLLQLTVNDLLVLYRAIHALTYQPKAELVEAVRALTQDKTAREAGLAALEAIDSAKQTPPSILIPVDASQRSPRERLYPMSFEVPLQELNLIELHTQTLKALEAYKSGSGDRAASYAEFDQLQRTYLATLAGFGAVLSKAKDIAIRGESASVGTIKLLAHMPTALQRMLDVIPSQFDVLNDIIKGREVFSNVGVVAPTSTLTRFITAKDDNEKKTLAWGVITDAQGVLRLTLRDFRPHVGLLVAVGQAALAQRLAQDYVDAYARGLNAFVRDLQRITISSRETKLARKEQTDA